MRPTALSAQPPCRCTKGTAKGGQQRIASLQVSWGADGACRALQSLRCVLVAASCHCSGWDPARHSSYYQALSPCGHKLRCPRCVTLKRQSGQSNILERSMKQGNLGSVWALQGVDWSHNFAVARPSSADDAAASCTHGG